ncbi:MAG: type restriction enzyme subunit [Verrucomicrobiota bacterium]|jgi:type I restriction enzyme S subunit
MSSKTKTTATKEEATPALVPKLRFPEFREAEKWKPITIEEASTPVTERVGERKLTPVSISAGIGFVPQTEKFGRDISGNQYQVYTLVRDGDFVFNKGNSLKFPQGCVYLLQGWGQVAAPNVFICFRLKKGYSNGFFQQCFEQNQHGRELKRHITSGARSNGLLNISKETFYGVAIPTPNPAEQQKIAECLSSVDELMAAQARKVAALKTHKKGLMQQLFPREGETQPRLRFPEFQNAGEWVSRIGTEITSKITKGSSPNWQGFSYQTQGVLFVTSENVRDGFLDVSEPKFLPKEFFAKQSNSHLLCGDILINIVGASIGRNCVYRLNEPAFTNQAVALFRVTKEHSFEFISYCYQQDRSQKAVSANQSDSARPNLSLSDLRNMEFLIPSLPEQQRIASCLTSLDDLIAAQSQKLESLKTHKKGLMQQLFPSPEEVEA